MFFWIAIAGVVSYFAWRRYKAVLGDDETKIPLLDQPEWMKTTSIPSPPPASPAPAPIAGDVETRAPEPRVPSAEQTLLFALPESGTDAAPILSTVLGMTAYDAQAFAGVPGVARPIRACDLREEARHLAAQLNRAGVLSAAVPRAQLSQLLASRKVVASWSLADGLSLETEDGSAIHPASAGLTDVSRVYVTKVTAPKTTAPAPGGVIKRQVVQGAAIAAFGVGAGSFANRAMQRGSDDLPTGPRSEKTYFLVLHFSEADPLFVYPNRVKSQDAGLGSAFVGLEGQLHAIIPRDHWTDMRSVPGSLLISAEGPEANVVVTHALQRTRNNRARRESAVNPG